MLGITLLTADTVDIFVNMALGCGGTWRRENFWVWDDSKMMVL
jgi:hypothetical protein